MSCRHANPIGACALCEEVTNAWDRGFATGEEKAKARIAELTAEVEKYKAAMNSIVDDYKQAFHTDWTTAANYADIARNALREG